MFKIPSLKNKKKYRTIAVLTSGGDAPGMNAAIRAVVRYGIVQNCKVLGINRGYTGILEESFTPMKLSSVANILQRGGTILKTSRCEAFHQKSTRKKAAQILKNNGVDALIVIGGDGSFKGAHLLENETGFPVIGIPGTIDNDIIHTEDTIGFDTAVNTAIDAIDRIRDTASSHERLFLVEVMGRSSGFIAAHVGIGGGAETIIVPEEKMSFSDLKNAINRGTARGKTSSIIIVAEGKKPGLSTRLAQELEEDDYQPKVCILGHTQRGGSPTAHDRVLASALGAASVSYLLSGVSNAMIGITNNKISATKLKKVIDYKKPLPKEVLKLATVLAT